MVVLMMMVVVVVVVVVKVMLMMTMLFQAVMEPHALRPAYWKWLLRVTHNKYVDVCPLKEGKKCLWFSPCIASMHSICPKVLICHQCIGNDISAERSLG